MLVGVERPEDLPEAVRCHLSGIRAQVQSNVGELCLSLKICLVDGFYVGMELCRV